MTIPERLYHYTNGEGLLGIVESRRLWASDIRHLNDETEVSYARELLKERSEALAATLDASYGGSVVRMAVVALADEGRIPDTFVASLCEVGDNLSLWRAYGDDCRGYSLGFNVERIGPSVSPYSLVRIIYDRSEQEAHMDNLLQEAAEIMQQWGSNPAAAPDPSMQCLLLAYGLMIAVWAVKNPHFEDEREWRLERMALATTPPPITQLREARWGSVPYEEIHLGESPDEFALSEIVIGRHAALDEAAVRAILDERGMTGVTVRRSSIRIR